VPLLDSITSPKCRSIVCTDTEALKTSLFSELFKLNIGAIKVFLVSRKAFTIWSSMAERVLEIENSTDIKLSSSAETLRKYF
jgi:hypothetical protein